ncbi:S-adenosyl-L-methionine-dependent methyltransferase [Aspergillus pseudoustus]|uniref:S-adenosyl-L-methionine-dependent methyltransferase n=1 Tax=Aspergillus pseudoustus TaxID=1810923 RepID=A0ABR4JDC0_9EURO
MTPASGKLATTPSTLPRTGLAALLAQLSIPGEIQLPNGSIIPVGDNSSSSSGSGSLYRVTFTSEIALRTPMIERRVAEAYVSGLIDVEGHMPALFNARAALREKVPLRQKIQFVYDFLRSATRMNAKAIGEHYGQDDDFYLTFIDKRFRFYTHGLFANPEESIEQASEHKLEKIWASLDLKRGMRVLDIGGGWGGVTQYCGARGVHVTTLTLAPNGARYVQRLIEEKGLSGRVFLEDFLAHEPEDEPYDAAVSLGAIEHLPDYRRFASKVWDVLKPGAKFYLDGSAAVTKYAISSWTRENVWRGAHSFMTVQDIMGELLNYGFSVDEVVNETRDYEWTMLEWARRLDVNREEIVAGYGEEMYRTFRVFLWGGAHAFRTRNLQAYHLVAERLEERGPRPGVLTRAWQFLGKLR